MNYATWSSTNKGTAANLTNGNLTASATLVAEVLCSLPINTGSKVYWEVTANEVSATNGRVGIEASISNLNAAIGTAATPEAWVLIAPSHATGQILNGGVYIDNGYANTPLNAGSIVGIALDLTANTIQFYVNGVAAGTAVSVTGGVPYYAAVGVSAGGASFTANFGATPFTYSVPDGFQAGIFQ